MNEKTIEQEMQDEDILRLASGVKDDTGKLPYHLLGPEFLAGIASVLQFGAIKYAPRNWEKGMDWSRPFSALMRHMWAWWAGEKNDPETGISHLYHAACCLMFLACYEERAIGADDRPPSQGAQRTSAAQHDHDPSKLQFVDRTELSQGVRLASRTAED